MKIPFLLVLLALTGLAGCGDGSSKSPASDTNSASPLTAPVDYLGAIGKAQQHAVKTIDTASITQAIQLFQTENGRLPKDLDELVKEGFLASIPKAPYGMKIVYDAATGQVKVVKQ